MAFLGIFGKKKNSNNFISSPKYEGLRPYSGADVGLGANDLVPLSQQYRQQILERSRGEGLVGFDPRRRETLKSEFIQDLNDQEEEARRQDLAQAASQGLRGGIPLSISQKRGKDFSRARASGLADIDIEDLQARRDDINQATYAQPELVSLGSDIQSRRANFDLAEYESSMPTYIDQPQSNLLPALLSAAGTAAGAYFGGPAGAGIGGSIGSGLGDAYSKSPNKSIKSRNTDINQLMNYYRPRGTSTLY